MSFEAINDLILSGADTATVLLKYGWTHEQYIQAKQDSLYAAIREHPGVFISDRLSDIFDAFGVGDNDRYDITTVVIDILPKNGIGQVKT